MYMYMCVARLRKAVVFISKLVGHVGSNVIVSDCCVVGAACEVCSNETLSPDTIIYGSDCRRYTKTTPMQVSL